MNTPVFKKLTNPMTPRDMNPNNLVIPDYCPPSLFKATWDHFSYELGLRDGRVICFNSAEFCGQWVHLETVGCINSPVIHDERGIDVRISDIVWCRDCGS